MLKSKKHWTLQIYFKKLNKIAVYQYPCIFSFFLLDIFHSWIQIRIQEGK